MDINKVDGVAYRNRIHVSVRNESAPLVVAVISSSVGDAGVVAAAIRRRWVGEGALCTPLKLPSGASKEGKSMEIHEARAVLHGGFGSTYQCPSAACNRRRSWWRWRRRWRRRRVRQRITSPADGEATLGDCTIGMPAEGRAGRHAHVMRRTVLALVLRVADCEKVATIFDLRGIVWICSSVSVCE